MVAGLRRIQGVRAGIANLVVCEAFLDIAYCSLRSVGFDYSHHDRKRKEENRIKVVDEPGVMWQST